MDPQPISTADTGRRLFQEFVAHYDAPAYVRRARRVEDALEEILNRCRRKREEWLLVPRVFLGRLHGLAPAWRGLRMALATDDQLAVLDRLYDELSPRLRAPIAPTESPRVLRTALERLIASIDRFNLRWLDHLAAVDLDAVNACRAEYNRWYLLEKECALRSPRLARQGYRPFDPLTTADLHAILPPLPTPRLAL